MDIFSNLLLGFETAATLSNLGWCLAGVFLGTAIGVLPGLGPTATIAMLLPATFGLPPVSALIMLAGIYYGAQYGGSTTAILVNLPGETSSVVTALDGYQMARQGNAGRALATAAIGSFFAGTVVDDPDRALRPAAGRGRAEVRPGRVLLADGARARGLDRAGARLAAARPRHDHARPAARAWSAPTSTPARPRFTFGMPRARRRHRLRDRRHGHVRHRRDHRQPGARSRRAP